MRLVYHRGYGDYGLRDYVYLWNLLARIPEDLEPVEVIVDASPFEHATKRWQRLVAKGLDTPVNGMGKGGKHLGTTLLLYSDAGLEYYWNGRAEVERILEMLGREGTPCLTRFL